MLVLTKNSYFLCDHGGRADPAARQSLVRIDNVRVLVTGDPVGRNIATCTHFVPAAGIKPCKTTLAVDQGYSPLVRIDGSRICLSSVEGYTDGMPLSQVKYKVHRTNQDWVSSV